MVRLVSIPDVRSHPVRIGVNGHRLNAQLMAGPNNPHGDLPPIGDEQFVKFTWI
jgi:hypothetical protein